MRLFSALLCFLLLTSPARADEGCEHFAHTIVERILAVLHGPEKDETKVQLQLSALFTQAVDTDWIGAAVLGEYWTQASGEERATYLTKYRQYLNRSYISKFDDETIRAVQDIKILSFVPVEAGQFKVASVITFKGDDDVHVNYLMVQSAHQCRVRDIQVEGVSLLVTQRSEFQSLALGSGIKGVIRAMDSQLQE